MKGLTVGRIVHYVTVDFIHRAAIVTQVPDKAVGIVNLVVFSTNGAIPTAMPTEAVFSVRYSEEHTGNTWHWIEAA
jgi:hypothetical protein